MPKSKRIQNLDALKGVAIILVMIGHCIVWNNMQDGIVYDAIKAIQMPLFMVVSGYTSGMMHNMDSYVLFRQKLGKRTIGYLVPFFTWIVILHIKELPQEIMATLFQIDRGLWFLMTLFILTVIMYTSMLIRDKTRFGKVGFLAVWGISAALLLLQNRAGNGFLGAGFTIYYMPFYFGGYVICKGYRLYREKEAEHIKKHTNYLITLFVFLLFLFLVVRFDMIVANNKIELLLQVLASIAGCLLCAQLVMLIPNGKIKEFLSFVGKYTLEIYVLHYHFATILGMQNRGLKLYSLPGIACVATTFVLMSVLTTGLIYIFKKFKITNLLLFGKLN